jgi:hypothetical protein
VGGLEGCKPSKIVVFPAVLGGEAAQYGGKRDFRGGTQRVPGLLEPFYRVSPGKNRYLLLKTVVSRKAIRTSML